MKVKRLVSTVALVGLLAPEAVLAKTVMELASYVGGSQYRTIITEAALQATPQWKATESLPPLSPKAALTSAEELLARLISNPKDWKNTAICLKNFSEYDRWVYILQFTGKPKGSWRDSEALQTMTLSVLMNGQAVEPHIKSSEGQPTEWESSCEFYDRIASRAIRQKTVPGTSFVIDLVDDQPGEGASARSGDQVEIKYEASVLGQANSSSSTEAKTLRFELGSGKPGGALDVVVSDMSPGGKRTVRFREEVAGGLREELKNLPPGSKLEVRLELLKVNPK